MIPDAADWTVCYRDDLVVKEELEKITLSMLGVEADLIAGWLYLAIGKHI